MMIAKMKLRQLMERIFDSCRTGLRKELTPAQYDQRRFDFAFHMTDWLSDLDELNELYEHPENADVDDACVSVISILVHIIPHLDAAGRLLLDEISDPFVDRAAEVAAPPRKNSKAHTRGTKPRTKAG
jgi:hypothetical protein